MNVSNFDKNLKIETSLREPDIAFYDVRRAPFRIYGLYNAQTEPGFKRLPDELGQQLNEGARNMYPCTAGGRVRFCTDSRYVAIKAEMPQVCNFSHMPLSGTAGFDLYLIDPLTGVSRFVKSYIPPQEAKNGFESIIQLPDNKMRYFQINFPTYTPLTNLYVGVQEKASVGEGYAYRPMDPVVYYGSSITQGGCSSRPGNAYQEIISQRMNLDYINLGFSGGAKGEEQILDYMASLRMSAFVSDYDHNAPNAAHLKNTHCKLYQRIRAAHPDIPYILLSRPDFSTQNTEDSISRRDVIIDTFRYATAQGDRNVFWVDGESLFRGPYSNLCTVDGCHPTDMGFALMADAVEHELRIAFTQKYL